ncbi:MAG: hypothetical protein R3C26_03300 [Calditrichia bacterium]
MNARMRNLPHAAHRINTWFRSMPELPHQCAGRYQRSNGRVFVTRNARRIYKYDSRRRFGMQRLPRCYNIFKVDTLASPVHPVNLAQTCNECHDDVVEEFMNSNTALRWKKDLKPHQPVFFATTNTSHYHHRQRFENEPTTGS